MPRKAGRQAEAADAHAELLSLLWGGHDATAMQTAHSLADRFTELGRSREAIAVQVRTTTRAQSLRALI